MKTIEFIKANGLQALTEQLGIAVKPFVTPEGDTLYLLDYNQIDSPKTDPIVMECRSLILDSEFNVVSRSFDRFFNYGEAQNVMPEIDWSKAVVYPKIDGSLIKIYNYKGTWYVSTRGMAFADSKVNGFDMTFKDLVMKALDVESEEKLREYFPLEGDYYKEYPEEWLRGAKQAQEFISGQYHKSKVGDIQFVECNGSIYQGMDYDNIPQGTEDSTFSIIEVNGSYYKVFLTYTSYGNFYFDEKAWLVEPKTVEVVVYE